MNKKESKILIFSKILIPESHFSMDLFNIYVALKFFPIIILTHDWNLQGESKGFSGYLQEITLGPIFHRNYSEELMTAMTFIMLFLCAIPLGILSYFFTKSRHEQRLPSKPKEISILLLYFVPYFFNQQFYMVITEGLGNYKEFSILYVVRAIFLIIIAIYLFLLSHYLSILSSQPKYCGNSVMLTEINKVNVKWNILPLAQAIIQLEGLVKFKYYIIIKAISRAIFTFYVILMLSTLKAQFYFNKFRYFYFVWAVCFVSCLIEFPFLYDYNNELKILTSNGQIIILKLLGEIIIASIIIVLIKRYEENTILKAVENYFGENGYEGKNVDYCIISKFFYYISRISAVKNLNSKFELKLINKLSKCFIIHRENCRTAECFCTKYESDVFRKQYFELCNFKKTNLKLEKELKFMFPVLYDQLEYYLIHILGNSKGVKDCRYYLICSIFFLQNDFNYAKSFYYLEEYISNDPKSKSFIAKIQIEIIKSNLLSAYKKRFKNDLALQQQNSNISRFFQEMQIEKYIKNSFEKFFSFLLSFQMNDGKNSKRHVKELEKVSFELESFQKKLNVHIKNAINISQEKIDRFQITAKYVLYGQFFFGKQFVSPLFLRVEKYSDFLTFPKVKILLCSLTYNNNNNNNHVGDVLNTQINIEVISDTLLVSLGYNSKNDSVKLKKLSDFIQFEQMSSVYEEFLTKKILMNQPSVSIPYFILAQKNREFLQMYTLDAKVFISFTKLYIFGKLKEEMKNECFVITDSLGNIIGGSEEFYKTFFISTNLLKKNQINLFESILNVSLEEYRKKKSYFNLITIFKNINNFYSSLLIETNEQEYSVIYQATLDLINKMKKNRWTRKEIIVDYIGIRGGEEKIIICFFQFDDILKVLEKKEFEKNNMTKNTSSFCRVGFRAPQSKLITLNISKDKEDLLTKIQLIKEQALNVLYFINGVNSKVIKKFGDVSFETVTNSATQRTIDKLKITSSKENFAVNSLHTKNQIHLQMEIGMLLISLFLFSTLFIFFYRRKLFDDGMKIVQMQLYLIFNKKILNALTSAVIGLQMQANKLQGETYDNGFNNTREYHISLINSRIIDYLTSTKAFRKEYYSKTFQKTPNSNIVNAYLFKNFNYTTLTKNYQKTTKESNLRSTFNYLHLSLNKYNYIDLSALAFNNSNGSYFVEGKSQNFSFSNDNLFVEEASVYMIENMITNVGYPLIDVINYYEEIVKVHMNQSQNVIIYTNIAFGVILSCLIIYQVVIYKYISYEIYVQQFCNIYLLEYFHIFLLQKVVSIRNCIDICSFDEIKKLFVKKLSIVNTHEENKIIMMTTKMVDSEYDYGIIPFKGEFDCEEEENRALFDRRVTLMDNFDFKKALKKGSSLKFQKNNSKKSASQLHIRAVSNNTLSTLDSFMAGNTSTNKLQNERDEKGKSSKGNSTKLSTKIALVSRSLALIALGFIILVVNISQFFLFIPSFNLIKNYSTYKTITLLRLDFYHQLLLIFEISVLKNEPLFFEYEGKNHEVFTETMTNYRKYEKEFEKIITNPSRSCFQRTLVDFEQAIRTERVCEHFVKVYHDNKEMLGVITFDSLKEFNQEEIIGFCKKVGKGFNEKGFDSAIGSLVNSVENLYKDFTKKEGRDAEYNLNLLREPIIETYQVDTNRMLEILFFDYQIAMINDYNRTYSNLNFWDMFFFISVLIFSVVVIVLYLKYFTIYFVAEESLNRKIWEMLHNTIIS